jgi:sulfite reductase (NADPH) flavoprotein alpha-component
MGETMPSATPVDDGWKNAPLAEPLADEARRLIARLDPRQRLWLSGFLAGRCDVAPVAKTTAPPITVLFGSQSGNAEGVAKRLVETLQRHDLPAVLLDMIDCRQPQLLAAHTLLVVVSTQGEGDPPDRALGFWELLNGRKAPRLAHLKFAVLALGDSSYANFCETGRQLDARLEALGAQRLQPRVDCDVDFEAPATGWIDAVLGKLPRANGAASVGLATASSEQSSVRVATAYTRKNPFHAELLVNQRLTATGSTKDVRRIELALGDSGIVMNPVTRSASCRGTMRAACRRCRRLCRTRLKHPRNSSEGPCRSRASCKSVWTSGSSIVHFSIAMPVQSSRARYASSSPLPTTRS